LGHTKGSTNIDVYSYEYYTKKSERSQINNVTIHLKLLEKQEQAKSQIGTHKETMKNRAEINEMELKRRTRRIMKHRIDYLNK
jgi:hypothetical protein